MRRYTFYFLVAFSAFGLCSFLLISCASAQEKNITKSNEKKFDENAIEEGKFKEILAKATQNLKGQTYRLTKTIENFYDRDANSESVETNILEIVQPDKKREVEEFKSAAKNTRTERIWDGKNLYEKVNDGEWEKYGGGGNGSGGGDYSPGRITTTYKFSGKTTLNNQTANSYEAETHRIANKFTRTSQYQVHYIVKTKYWISEDGRFLKILKESEIDGSKALTRETEIYEYDASIKIEAPIK